MPASSQVLVPIRVSFDDEHAVGDAGPMLTGTLIGKLGLERTIDAKVSRGYRPGRKLLTIVSTMLVCCMPERPPTSWGTTPSPPQPWEPGCAV